MFSTNPLKHKASAVRRTGAYPDHSIVSPSFPTGNTVMQRCRTAVLFDNIGPYHRVRLEAAADVCELLAVEFGKSSGEYSWRSDEGRRFRRVTINTQGESRALPGPVFRERLAKALKHFDAEVVFLPGWSCRGAIFGMDWCLRNGKRAVVMSESASLDAMRLPVRESVKRGFLRLAAAALAGGTPQKEYLIQLGMEPGHISMGYDAVDNEYFAKGAANVRSAERGERKAYQSRTSEARRRHQLPPRYFLASARFIERKNLPGLIEAYARYRSLARSEGRGAGKQVPELVLLGDGPLRPALRSQLNALGLQACVHLRGFQQYEELPVFYGLADAFVHASTTEQWGLVVNEAMASGLPVVVSNRCGCVYDLVREGCNGFAFDPHDVEQLARLMLRVGEMEDEERTRMGDASGRIIAGWGPDRFARGLKEAIECAMRAGPIRAGMLDRLLLRGLILR